MSRSDLIADSFCIIRNAVMAKKDAADIPASNTMKAILAIMKKYGYVENYKSIEDKNQGRIRVYLKYTAGKPALRRIQRVSRPGLRKYTKADSVPVVLRGRGMAIISTSSGIITDKQARESGIGGEVVAYIW